jgi:hypothetical protein
MAAGERRSTSGNAVTTTLTANITSGDTVIPIAVSTGYPDGTNGPFFIKVDSETIKCISRVGLNLNVQTVPVTGRGWENTSAASHTTSAVVNLVFTSTDADEANAHHADLGDNHPSLLNAARHDLTARHPASVLPLGSPGNSAPGDTASAGVASSIARSDHRHGREADSTTRVGATLLATAFAVPTGATTSIAWTSETADTDGFIVANGANTVLTVPANKGGLYAITTTGFWSTAFTEYRQLIIRLNGLAFASLPLCFDNLFTQSWGGTITFPLAATNTIEIALLQFNAASQNTTARLDIYRVAA